MIRRTLTSLALLFILTVTSPPTFQRQFIVYAQTTTSSATATATTFPEPVFVLPQFQNPPFSGTPVPNVGIRGWLKNANGTYYVGFRVGQGGMGMVSTHPFYPYQAACAKVSLPSPTYGMLFRVITTGYRI
jgi:hypothetical protein